MSGILDTRILTYCNSGKFNIPEYRANKTWVKIFSFSKTQLFWVGVFRRGKGKNVYSLIRVKLRFKLRAKIKGRIQRVKRIHICLLSYWYIFFSLLPLPYLLSTWNSKLLSKGPFIYDVSHFGGRRVNQSLTFR